MDTLSKRRRQKNDPCNLRLIIRLWGIITAIVVCGIGVDILVHGYQAGIYILISSGIIFFLEIKWILTLFIQLFCTNGDYTSVNTKCTKCWSLLRILGGWRLAPAYIALGVSLILYPHNLWLSHVGGTLLIVLGILRLFTILSHNVDGKDEGLLPQFEDSFEKSENLSEPIDDEVLEIDQNLDDNEAQDLT